MGDARDKVAVLVDDMADTCGTLELAAQKLIEFGAKRVLALVTHGVLSEPALERIQRSALEKVIVTNTLPQTRNLERCTKLEEIDISHVLAETIRRAHHGESISKLFTEVPYVPSQPYRSHRDLEWYPDRTASLSSAPNHQSAVPVLDGGTAPLQRLPLSPAAKSTPASAAEKTPTLSHPSALLGRSASPPLRHQAA